VWSRGVDGGSGQTARLTADGELEPVAVDESLTSLLFAPARRSTSAPARRREPALGSVTELLPRPVERSGAAADVAAERTAALVGW
jgi:hypothetical protein